MNTILKTSVLSLSQGAVYSEDELKAMGITPTNIDCFEFYNYLLWQKNNKRIIVKPLPHGLYKVIRIYDFIPAFNF